MKAARLHEANKPLRIEKIPIPQTGPKDVLTEVKASTIDGTVPHLTHLERDIKDFSCNTGLSTGRGTNWESPYLRRFSRPTFYVG